VAEPVVEKIEDKELHAEASEAYLSVSNAAATAAAAAGSRKA
jgi:hypothetical protein